ncbi:MAG: AAA family ATPase [Sneathiella sp.]|uniref:AAA family ATPase n=1 Tax=Sneathiella sp. TaxID=1964365 RepID=UPI003002C7E5
MTALEQINLLKQKMQASIIGQEDVIDRLLIGLLANGNILLEGLPGLAKTRAVKALARNLETEFGRIQFTPDLLPADVTGSEVYHSTEDGGVFKFDPGPIFGNIILGDEINRAPAKVQSAMLEAMEERQVTVAGNTHKMPDLFMVLATQNPIEQEGTYPLPEAQLDRFLMHVSLEYGDEASEIEIIRLVRGEMKSSAAAPSDSGPTAQSVVFDARKEIEEIHTSEAIETYMVDLIYATRFPDRYSEELDSWIEIGASPRGSLGLDICSRAHAWMQGQDFVSPDNVRAIIKNVLRHRLILSFEANADNVTPDQVIEKIVELVAAP